MNEILLEPGPDGTVTARHQIRRYRFMFDDGSTLDVVGTVRDDSDLRAAVLKWTNAKSIEGVARIPEEDPTWPSQASAPTPSSKTKSRASTAGSKPPETATPDSSSTPDPPTEPSPASNSPE